MQRIQITVGDNASQLKGFTNTHIQAAVDRAAALGGGEVTLSAGTFAMRDALHLRTRVTVRGQGNTTILRKAPMKAARIQTFQGFGHTDLVVDSPEVFSLGDGIVVGDDKAHGFYQTTATLVGREGNSWLLNRPYAHDYHINDNGFAKTLFPLISAVDVSDAIVSDMALDGNVGENDYLNGCRGGAFFAHRTDRILAERLHVLAFNGEGFSFQTCEELTLAHCTAMHCTGNGFHPGSGSLHFHIHHCHAHHNQACGLFYCLHVRHGVLEDSVFEENGKQGIWVGSRDCDQANRRLTLRRNGLAGIEFVDAPALECPHRNRFEDCLLEANCQTGGTAEIVLNGCSDGTRLLNNTIRPREGVHPLLNPGTMTDLTLTNTPAD